jgi:hypothetical protein
MKTSCQFLKISDLIPFEKQLSESKYKKAIKDLERDGKFDPPAAIFELDINGMVYYCVRNGHHHIRAALDRGELTVPCKIVTPSPELQKMMRNNFDNHFCLQGFGKIPILSHQHYEKAIKDDNN